MYNYNVGDAQTPEGIKVEENVQFGPIAPGASVALPSWIGTQNTLMYMVAGLIGAYVLYKYVYDVRGE